MAKDIRLQDDAFLMSCIKKESTKKQWLEYQDRIKKVDEYLKKGGYLHPETREYIVESVHEVESHLAIATHTIDFALKIKGKKMA